MPEAPLPNNAAPQSPQIATPMHQTHTASTAALTLTSLGVVFGDIGTSPLYTFKTVLDLAGGSAQETALGLLSLVLWTLFLITSIKYATFVMRIDNRGEGGILALMSLLGAKHRNNLIIAAVGLMGAALIYGDGAITPAISVLSALEGLEIVTDKFTPYVLPAATVILLALFAIQPLGTAKIGKLFGPVMTLWFVSIAALGIYGVLQHPGVFAALSPTYALGFLIHGGWTGFLVLGGVFLCVTGAEALYADMGHVGAFPIRLSWYGLVLPALVLNYAGQAAILLNGGKVDGNIFFHLCPAPLVIPMVVLSTIATIIASQSIITGAFSMTRQAIQLGWFPRVRIKQTSSEGYGQIYVGTVNWGLMLVTLALTLGFQKSDNLAAAYGIAVSMTMMLTSALMYIAMREIWGWSLWRAGLLAGFFLIVDAAFTLANSMKILEGGWVPLALAWTIWTIMLVWHKGIEAISAGIEKNAIPIADFIAKVTKDGIPRVPGTAVFMTRTTVQTPPVLRWHVKHNRALHKHIIALTIHTESVPWIEPATRLAVAELSPDVWRITASYGFMERPDVPELLRQACANGCKTPVDDLTYYIGHETITHRADGKGLPGWQEEFFAFMLRNSAHMIRFFQIPVDQVVEIGRQIEI
jgi:KUP system potassium uptake protein